MMRPLGVIRVCTTKLLVLGDGDRTYYIDPEAGVAYEDIREAIMHECPCDG